MKLTPHGIAMALVASGIGLAAPAFAQGYGTAPSQQPSPASQQPAAAAPASTYKPEVSKAARKEIAELQAAVNAKDVANIPAKLAAAKAKAQTKDDLYLIAQMQLKAAVDAKDEAGMISGLEAVLASGALPAADNLLLHMDLGKIRYNAKAYDQAGASFEEVLKIDPNNIEALVMQAETRNAQKRVPEAVSLIQRAIAAKLAAGQKAEEAWYKRAVAIAYNANLPSSPEIGRQWVAAYPTAKNWRDVIRIYQTSSKMDDASMIDSMRLARVTGALQSENDYFRLANTLVTKGYAGEAKAVLDQGFAANSISKSKATFSQLYTLATSRSQGDRASLGASATAAKAAPDAKKAMVTADAYYGYGDFAQAAELYRVALTKSGVDKDLANLRLGMALAQTGDKAGATTALNAAGGAQSEVAKLWLTYVSTAA